MVQIWIDPSFPDAHRDPALRAYLYRRAEQDRMGALIRSDDKTAMALLAPPLMKDGQWCEKGSLLGVPT